MRASIPILLLLASSRLLAAEVDYARDVKPLLAKKCQACHGPLKQEAGLRLDAGSLIHKGGDEGPVIVVEKPAESRLIAKVSAADPADRMPPEGEGEPLTAEQVSVLTAWIDGGAPFPADETILDDPRQHWAYLPPQRPEVPQVDDPDWSGNPVDAFIAAKHHAQGLTPLPEADRLTLLRRVYLDLIGLPPTRDEQHAFLADPSPTAYEQVVDRLLCSPQYGERWGRHWMDVWRYSDWDGYGNELRGSQRHLWRWRDWIVESLNADKPYDRMVLEMLAGDELAPEDPDVLRATGLLARHHYKLNRDLWMDNAVEHTFKAFLGITINCAKCHDHKYDPIEQQAYYQARAIFEPYKVRIDRLPGVANVEQDGLTRAYDAEPAAQTFVYLRGNEKQPDKEHPVTAAVPAVFGRELAPQEVPLPTDAWYPDLRPHVVEESLAAARGEIDKARDALDKARAERDAAVEQVSDSPPATPDEARAAVTAADGSVTLAEKKFAAAEAGLASMTARVAADRAKVAQSEAGVIEELSRAAAAAERRYTVLKTEIAVLEGEQQVAAAQGAVKPEDEKSKAALTKAEKELEDARKKFTEAQAALDKTDGDYTPFGTQYPQSSTGRRLALARWIVARDNPLAARVAVNHIWLRHFGTPLVAETFDFGLRAPAPLHQDLLDWLAVELMESGWRMKHLHRLMVTSRAYRGESGERRVESGEQRGESRDHEPGGALRVEDSSLSTLNSQLDTDNHYYWRANVRRLDAEVVRDSVLFVGGSLDLTRGGPDIDFEEGENVPRRSLYFRHAYEKQMRFLVLFDEASPNECYRRTESIVPQQALALANSGLSLGQSRRLARTLAETVKDAADGDGAFVTAAFEQVLCRPPSEEELAACREFLAQQREQLADVTSLTGFAGAAAADVPPSDDPALRARENLVHVLMNHNDFVTVR